MALSTLAASTMCSISSTTTDLMTIRAVSFDPGCSVYSVHR